jgi:hypothetical protein
VPCPRYVIFKMPGFNWSYNIGASDLSLFTTMRCWTYCTWPVSNRDLKDGGSVMCLEDSFQCLIELGLGLAISFASPLKVVVC